MKKMRFTLGLMLSMLFLGANVANAQFDYGLPSTGQMDMSVTVHPNGFYSSDVVIANWIYDPVLPNFPTYDLDTFPDGYNPWVFRFPKDRATPLTSQTYSIPYGNHNAWNDDTANIYDWKYNLTGGYYQPGSQTLATGNLFYWRAKPRVEAGNIILVNLNYTNGNELKPAVFRTITIGEWKLQTNGDNMRNKLYPVLKDGEPFKITRMLNPDVDPNLKYYRPWMDRETDIAQYYYYDDILALLSNDIIYSIEYEVVIHDEVDNNLDLDPLGTLPDNYIGVQLAPEDGITTDPNHLSGAGPDLMFYVPTRNWTFTAFSKTPIMVTLAPLYESDAHKIIPDADKAVIINDNGDGSFDITIRQILFNYKIIISSVEPSSGDGDGDQTGNLTLGKNNVYAALGRLYVQTDSPSTLSIYSVTGQLVKQETVSGNTSLALPKGLYIVQLNGKAYKVIN